MLDSNESDIHKLAPLGQFMQLLASQGISVVIPVYNGEKYLAEAIASVADQSLAAAEIIVVDDGSTDATGEIARQDANVTYIRQQNAGVAAAINHGVRAAQGKFISFLSADDAWRPEKLARQHVALNDAIQRLVFGHMQHFVSPELSAEVARSLHCPPEPMEAFSAGTLLTTLDTFRAVGPLDEGFATGEFIDWYGRAFDAGLDIIMLDDVVSLRRVHTNNHSTRSLREKTYLPVLKAAIARRRMARKVSEP